MKNDQKGTSLKKLHPDLHKSIRNIGGYELIHHPLLVVSFYPDDIERINEAFEHVKRLANDFLRSRRWLSFLVLTPRPYRFQAFIDLRSQVPDKWYWKLLAFVWMDSENPGINQFSWLYLFRSRRPCRGLIMTTRERRALKAMPDVLTVYRGYGISSARRGLSWSLSRDEAVRFAYRRAGKPKVVTGTCNKSDVIAYLNDRQEQEIVIDPEKVMGMKALKEIGPLVPRLNTQQH